MHTATRIAGQFIPTSTKAINPSAHCALMASTRRLNADYLRGLGVTTILGGEFEEGLTLLYRRL